MATQQERIRRCLSSLIVRFPFYGALALRLEHKVLGAKEADAVRLQTAATDGKRIFYRAQFLQRMSDQDLTFLIAHETLHAALSHPLRGSDKDDTEAWNIASDDTVNRLLGKEVRA
jgi:predicted metal-dependent peptidase